MKQWKKPELMELKVSETQSGGGPTLLDDSWEDADGNEHGTHGSKWFGDNHDDPEVNFDD